MRKPVGRYWIRSAWRDLGWGGRAALGTLLLAALVALVLGVTIPSTARHTLLDGRSSALRVVADAVASDVPLPRTGDPSDLTAFDAGIRSLLLGGETVGAKVWAADGTVLYATDPQLVGRRLDLPAEAEAAFGDRATHAIVDASEHPELTGATDRVIEFFFPIDDPQASQPLVFEVEQLADSLDAEITRISRTVWAGIGLGIGLLTAVLVSVLLAGAGAAEQRRRHTEALLAQVLDAQETERKRITSALHSDIGQRLYRVLYGLEGLRLKNVEPQRAQEELERLEGLVRGIDQSLRSELRMLHRDAVNEIGFSAALRELAETTRVETGLAVTLADRLDPPPRSEAGGMLLWAAEEAVINARKHAQASHISLSTRYQADRAILEVTDDGVGATAPAGVGLMTLEERLGLADGGLEIDTPVGGGTILRAWVPYDRSEA